MTDSGIALTDELMAEHLDDQRRLLENLGGQEQAQLAGLLQRLAVSLEDAAGA